MLRTRLLIMLLFVIASLFVALAKPLPTRAANPPTPVQDSPDPVNANPIVPPLPVVDHTPPKHAPIVRKIAAVKHIHVPLGEKIVKYAKRMIGVPYVYGGSSPHGFDCSGLTSYVYRHFHVAIARTSYGQYGDGRRVLRNRLKPGDLVFFHGLGHVGIYVGNGRFIHAPHTGTRVRIESLRGWYSGRFDGARRVVHAS
jgi:cell wall-associated NlpC family hydrolase